MVSSTGNNSSDWPQVPKEGYLEKAETIPTTEKLIFAVKRTSTVEIVVFVVAIVPVVLILFLFNGRVTQAMC